MANNALIKQKKWLKSQLKAYLIKYHKFPEETYLSAFSKALSQGVVNLAEKIIFAGLICFFSLKGLTALFPGMRELVWLGNSFPTYLFIIVSLGVIIISLKQIYEWKRRMM